MPKKINDFEQRSMEWRAAKVGMFSGSDFHVFLGNSASKKTALYEKLCERLYGDYDYESYSTPAMERGTLLEPEARRVYSALSNYEVEEVGLVIADEPYADWVVCSPDGLVGDDGIIEIKCPLAKNFMEWLDNDFYIKPEYKTQVQFNLFVTDRKWCDFIYYHPRGGIYKKRIERDEEYIAKIKTALDECIEKIKALEEEYK